jgi:hypothetical protein
MADQYYTATIQVLYRADDESEACDAMSEWLRRAEQEGAIKDWAYQKRDDGTHQEPLPYPCPVTDEYEEGEFMAVKPSPRTCETCGERTAGPDDDICTACAESDRRRAEGSARLRRIFPSLYRD